MLKCLAVCLLASWRDNIYHFQFLFAHNYTCLLLLFCPPPPFSQAPRGLLRRMIVAATKKAEKKTRSKFLCWAHLIIIINKLSCMDFYVPDEMLTIKNKYKKLCFMSCVMYELIHTGWDCWQRDKHFHIFLLPLDVWDWSFPESISFISSERGGGDVYPNKLIN